MITYAWYKHSLKLYKYHCGYKCLFLLYSLLNSSSRTHKPQTKQKITLNFKEDRLHYFILQKFSLVINQLEIYTFSLMHSLSCICACVTNNSCVLHALSFATIFSLNVQFFFTTLENYVDSYN
jgi:hypothetical protein